MAAILKWLPQPPAVTSGWGPVLKSTVIGYSNCVPSLLLVSQSARNGSKWALSDRTIPVSSICATEDKYSLSTSAFSKSVNAISFALLTSIFKVGIGVVDHVPFIK